MFLAPLNFDRFFKKVFSDITIAKRFLEDFLDIEIETIEPLERKHKITDGASAVEFDFRCKIDGQYTIIDMQQWYKTDVVKRFSIYHALGSALQLEDLPKREYPEIDGKKFDTKIYSLVMPTITLIWMAHDNLGFEDDYVAYALYPEQTVEFLKNDALWTSKELKNIDIERQKVLALLNNKTKNLDFLAKNRLIFAFQQNIVKNKKLKKYCDWFELAEKTRNQNNIEADFESYKKNPTLMAVMERIETNKLPQEELSALEALERELALSAIWRIGLREEMKEELTPVLKKELTQELTQELTPQIKQELTPQIKQELTPQIRQELTPQIKQELTPQIRQEITPQIKQQARDERDNETVIAAYQQGLALDLIMSITLLSLEKINAIIEKYKQKAV